MEPGTSRVRSGAPSVRPRCIIPRPTSRTHDTADISTCRSQITKGRDLAPLTLQLHEEVSVHTAETTRRLAPGRRPTPRPHNNPTNPVPAGPDDPNSSSPRHQVRLRRRFSAVSLRTSVNAGVIPEDGCRRTLSCPEQNNLPNTTTTSYHYDFLYFLFFLNHTSLLYYFFFFSLVFFFLFL
jgi:hypothetical protein